MASELSSFIESELRKQGIADDEEQRLLSNLRVKPLSVQAPAPAGAAGWSGRKKAAVALGLALLFAALIALVLKYRGHPALSTSHLHGAITDPEAGVEFFPDPATKIENHDEHFEKAKNEFEAAAAALEAEANAEAQREASKIADAEADAAAHGDKQHDAAEHAKEGEGRRLVRRMLRAL